MLQPFIIMVDKGTLRRPPHGRARRRADSGQGSHKGHHHAIPLGLVATVEGDQVRLSANADVAVEIFEEEA